MRNATKTTPPPRVKISSPSVGVMMSVVRGLIICLFWIDFVLILWGDGEVMLIVGARVRVRGKCWLG